MKYFIWADVGPIGRQIYDFLLNLQLQLRHYRSGKKMRYNHDGCLANGTENISPIMINAGLPGMSLDR